jgi:hypothetical protein
VDDGHGPSALRRSVGSLTASSPSRTETSDERVRMPCSSSEPLPFGPGL